MKKQIQAYVQEQTLDVIEKIGRETWMSRSKVIGLILDKQVPLIAADKDFIKWLNDQ